IGILRNHCHCEERSDKAISTQLFLSARDCFASLAMTSKTANAFDRLRVVDFTTTIAGPHCTRLLADLGAEVIKLEAPEGDMMRSRPPLRDGASTSFGQLNTGKKSVILDLKRPEAIEIVRRLVAATDVVVEN